MCLALQEDADPGICLNLLESSGELSSLYQAILKAELLVFFNAKFELHWFRRLRYPIPSNKRIWCCQLAEFILSHQSIRYPSLEDTAIKYQLGHKIDVVKEEYWNKGIDTDKIPKEILYPYAIQDVNLTYKVYLKQLEQFKQQPKLFTLFKLACQDLMILAEMEWNGLIYDEELCNQKATNITKELQELDKTLSSVYPDVPINFNSGDQLSAFLYGGKVYSTDLQEIGTYKTGVKAGQVKYKKIEIEHVLPRLITPLPRSELKKEGVWATDIATLKKLKGPAAKKYVSLLLKRSELEKLNSTYYKGLPQINKEMNWRPGEIHGQFNQVVAATGRLSSSAPNLQNFAGDCLDVFVSRYED